MSNILIIGGFGFLGKNLSKNLSLKHNVFITDCLEKNESNYFKIKLNQTESLIKIINEKNINIIIHLVSSMLPFSKIDDYFEDVENIYNPTIKLLDYCAEHKINFIYFSSGGAVYGSQKEIFNEHTKREPVSYYGLSKLNFENTIVFFHNTKGLNYLIIRPSNPYGYGQNIYGRQGIIAVIIGRILKNEPIQIWGDGKAVKDYIYIDDFVYYVSSLIDKNNVWNDIYNIGSGIGSSVKDVLDAFSENEITLPKIEYISENKSDVKRMILDCTKIQEIFPDYKLITLQNGIKKFWERVNEEYEQ